MGLSTYYAPTRVIFGKDAEKEAGKELKRAGAKKVLIHYGSSRIEKDGFLKSVTADLDKEGIWYTTLSGVVPNPRLSLVRKGIELVKQENIDFILAIGGGSVIDSSKAIAYGAMYDKDVWDFYSQKAVPQAALPIGCILTMAAAGSEMSDSSVITNEEGNLKRGCNSDLCRLKFALENPCLTYSLPPFQTACATIDIMMHTLERYFTSGEVFSFTAQQTFALLRSVKDAGLKALEKSDDYEARAVLMWASSVSHNGFMALGNDSRGDWATHQIEHELSGEFDVAHGAGLSVIWPSWARYVRKADMKRFAELGYEVFNVKNSGDVDKDSLETIKAFEEFCHAIHMPITAKELNIELTDEVIANFAEKCTFFGKRSVGALVKLDGKAIAEIYKGAR